MVLTIDGNPFFALTFGAWPRTLLAHSGWAGSCDDWFATPAPSPPIGALQSTAIAEGQDPGPAGGHHRPGHGEDVFRVMDAQGIDRCALAGFSAGTSNVLRAVLALPMFRIWGEEEVFFCRLLPGPHAWRPVQGDASISQFIRHDPTAGCSRAFSGLPGQRPRMA